MVRKTLRWFRGEILSPDFIRYAISNRILERVIEYKHYQWTIISFESDGTVFPSFFLFRKTWFTSSRKSSELVSVPFPYFFKNSFIWTFRASILISSGRILPSASGPQYPPPFNNWDALTIVSYSGTPFNDFEYSSHWAYCFFVKYN